MVGIFEAEEVVFGVCLADSETERGMAKMNAGKERRRERRKRVGCIAML
jgi:hypothetical protein